MVAGSRLPSPSPLSPLFPSPPLDCLCTNPPPCSTQKIGRENRKCNFVLRRFNFLLSQDPFFIVDFAILDTLLHKQASDKKNCSITVSDSSSVSYFNMSIKNYHNFFIRKLIIAFYFTFSTQGQNIQEYNMPNTKLYNVIPMYVFISQYIAILFL